MQYLYYVCIYIYIYMCVCVYIYIYYVCIYIYIYIRTGFFLLEEWEKSPTPKGDSLVPLNNNFEVITQ